MVSPMGSTANNADDKACLFRQGVRYDGRVSFEERGPGMGSACPGPDGAGSKTAAIKKNGPRCYLTGYRATGAAGATEYHGRLNNTAEAGIQTVVFCFDPNDDGRADARIKDSITIRWVR